MSAPPLLPCTRLLFSGGDDLSPWSATPVLMAAGAFVPNAEATAVSGPARSLELRVDAELSTSGILLDHGTDVGVIAYRLRIDAGVVRASDGLGELGEIEVPGLLEGEAHGLLVRWASEANPGSEGPADAVRSCLHVYNIATGEHARAYFVHAAAPANPSGTLSVGGLWLGGQLTKALGKPLTVRIGSTFQTGAAMREHWLGPPVFQATPVGITRLERPRAPQGAGFEAALAGPVYTLGARSLRSNSHRPVSRVVAGAPAEPTVQRFDLAKVYPAHWVFPSGEGWAGSLAWLWRRRLPRQCDQLLIHVRAALWSVSLEPPAPLGLRACASDRPPAWLPAPGEPAAKVEVSTLELGSGGLFDLAFSAVSSPRDEEGYTWLWFEFRLQPGDDTRYSLAGWSWMPLRISDGADLDLDLAVGD